ncbi:hypothetical protein IWX49DRAFT_554029 [Phyllosticta citricarpa]
MSAASRKRSKASTSDPEPFRGDVGVVDALEFLLDVAPNQQAIKAALIKRWTDWGRMSARQQENSLFYTERILKRYSHPENDKSFLIRRLNTDFDDNEATLAAQLLKRRMSDGNQKRIWLVGSEHFVPSNLPEVASSLKESAFMDLKTGALSILTTVDYEFNSRLQIEENEISNTHYQLDDLNRSVYQPVDINRLARAMLRGGDSECWIEGGTYTAEGEVRALRKITYRFSEALNSNLGGKRWCTKDRHFQDLRIAHERRRKEISNRNREIHKSSVLCQPFPRSRQPISVFQHERPHYFLVALLPSLSDVDCDTWHGAVTSGGNYMEVSRARKLNMLMVA